jgi:hypothetical protein
MRLIAIFFIFFASVFVRDASAGLSVTEKAQRIIEAFKLICVENANKIIKDDFDKWLRNRGFKKQEARIQIDRRFSIYKRGPIILAIQRFSSYHAAKGAWQTNCKTVINSHQGKLRGDLVFVGTWPKALTTDDFATYMWKLTSTEPPSIVDIGFSQFANRPSVLVLMTDIMQPGEPTGSISVAPPPPPIQIR